MRRATLRGVLPVRLPANACSRPPPQPAIFEDLAQEAINLCRQTLVSAAEMVKAQNASSSVLDGHLFLVRHLLILKEMTRTNNAKVIFMPMETSALLSSVGAIKEVFAETGQKSADRPPPVQPRQLDK